MEIVYEQILVSAKRIGVLFCFRFSLDATYHYQSRALRAYSRQMFFADMYLEMG